tara:strand:+ start:68 stop:352 length:285 start_codon:yes stop_codon:yes gene_type:complete
MTVVQEGAVQFLVQLLQPVAVEAVIITPKLLVEVVQFNTPHKEVTLLQLVHLKETMPDHKFNLAAAELAVEVELLLQAEEPVELEETVLYQDLQ